MCLCVVVPLRLSVFVSLRVCMCVCLCACLLVCLFVCLFVSDFMFVCVLVFVCFLFVGWVMFLFTCVCLRVFVLCLLCLPPSSLSHSESTKFRLFQLSLLEGLVPRALFCLAF